MLLNAELTLCVIKFLANVFTDTLELTATGTAYFLVRVRF